MQILVRLSKKIKKSFRSYALALILSPERKVCTKMANFLGITHDFLQRFLANYSLWLPIFPKLMFSIANFHAKEQSGYFVIDDTTMSKLFIKFLAGAYTIYNTAMGRPDRGFNLVVIAWSNGRVTIPLMFDWYFHKEIVGQYFRTKTEVAIDLICKSRKKVPFSYILFDGHYSTIDMLKFLTKHNFSFVAKIPRNRKVAIKKIFDQIQNLQQIKLVRNERNRATQALYHGMKLWFSVHKRLKRTGDYSFTYIVSNMKLDPKIYMKVYKQRWCIEEMFRTMKQSLGFAQCQSTKLEKQQAHIFSIFFSYSFLETFKNDQKLKNPEAALKSLRKLKVPDATNSINAFGGNFQCFA